uniref:CDGSH iron-sulfur domain-containing protein 3, mitochondrial n=1 Tax=Panagrellus redivivus TaxID=6233 RepID=A0A7E4WB84_PANRE
MFAKVGYGIFTPKFALIRHGSTKNVKILNPSAASLPFPAVHAGKKPALVQLEAGKRYSYCTCGLSAKQPFCDGSHKGQGKTLLRPIRFTVDKTDDYYLCLCKGTETAPLCDGRHKKLTIRPSSADATTFVAFSADAPVYEGVARTLGYKPRNGGFQ